MLLSYSKNTKILIYTIILQCFFVFPSFAKDKLKVGIGYWEYVPLIAIAQDKGYFDKYDLSIELKTYNNGIQTLDEICNGKLDMATAAEYGFASKSLKNGHIRVIASMATLNVLDMIVRKDSGIKTFKDLRNKRVGVPKNTQAEFELNKMLNYNRMSIKDIKPVYISIDKLASGIRDKKIDGAMLWGKPLYDLKKNLNGNYYIIPNTFTQEYQWLLVGTDKKLIESDKYIRFMRALFDAQKFLQESPEEAKNIHRKYCTIPDDYFNFIIKKVNFNISLNQSLIVALEDQARWIISNSKLKIKIPNYLDFIELDILSEVKPEVIGIIH